MKTRILPSLSLLILLLASCAPAAPVAEPPAQPPVAVEPTSTPIPSVIEEQPVDSASAPADVVAAPTEVVAPTPLLVATSRGPNLEATDPRGVNLASGNLQFVEFFRFT